MCDVADFIWGADIAQVTVEEFSVAVDALKITSEEDGHLTIQVGHHAVYIDLRKGAALELPRYPESYGIPVPVAA